MFAVSHTISGHDCSTLKQLKAAIIFWLVTISDDGFSALNTSYFINRLQSRKTFYARLKSTLLVSNGPTESSNNISDGDGSVLLGSKVELSPICRIVSRADSRLPSDPSVLPPLLLHKPFILNKLDTYYHARGRLLTQNLGYLRQNVRDNEKGHSSTGENELISVLRDSLENAGFELLSKRDIDLCNSLNVGYLLRLSIRPDLNNLHLIAKEVYPEHFDSDGTPKDENKVLFDGKVLVYWRGYSKEVTKGRLIFPKLDYLQANLVQRSASWFNRLLGKIETQLAHNFSAQKRKIKQIVQGSLLKGANSIRDDNISRLLKRGITEGANNLEASLQFEDKEASKELEGMIKFGRYGGTKIRLVGASEFSDALDPFTICEVQYCEPHESSSSVQLNGRSSYSCLPRAIPLDAEDEMNDRLNHRGYTCEYDAVKEKGKAPQKMQLLERISISNLVDIFSSTGRKKFIKALFEKSELVEPTYEEVVVLWRPIEKQERVYRPPRLISEFADMFDIEGFEQPPKEDPKLLKERLEIRTFEGVPMANLQAVLPKTKLVFRPADAFLFDLISIVTFFVVAGSIRLDSPKLDLLAIISVSLWTIRTVIRYSNKLARYDLLVKNFLTSKISHRNEGALKYIVSEAGSQHAIRSSLVHSWLSGIQFNRGPNFDAEEEDSSLVARSDLELTCADEVNKMLKTGKEVKVNVDKALDDLEALGLIEFSADRKFIKKAKDLAESIEAIKKAWADLLDPGICSFDTANQISTIHSSDASGTQRRP